MTASSPEFEIEGPLPIPPRIRMGILRHACESGGEEACGVILGRDSEVLAWYPCRNAHAEPARSFLLHPHDLRQALELAERLGLEVLGFWHSHPGGPATLSPEDLTDQPRDWLQWLVAPRRD